MPFASDPSRSTSSPWLALLAAAVLCSSGFFLGWCARGDVAAPASVNWSETETVFVGEPPASPTRGELIEVAVLDLADSAARHGWHPGDWPTPATLRRSGYARRLGTGDERALWDRLDRVVRDCAVRFGRSPANWPEGAQVEVQILAFQLIVQERS